MADDGMKVDPLVVAKGEVMRQISRHSDSLYRALRDVERRSAAAIKSMDDGYSVTGGLGSLLADDPAKVERASGALQAAIEAALPFCTAAEINEAYAKRSWL